MAPEQAKGKPVDRRADIWAFGVVLYEMLTSKPLFHGGEAVEILASVIKETPSLDALPPTTPRAVHRLIERCIEKDPKRRLQAIGEARIVVEDAVREEPPPLQAGLGGGLDAGSDGLNAGSPLTPSPLTPAPPVRAGARPWAWIVATACLLGLAGLGFVHFRETPPAERTLRYTIAAPENSTVHSFAISPDGRTVAIAATVSGK